MCEQLHAVLPRGVEIVRLEVERALRHADRQRAVPLHRLAPLQGLLEEVLLRHALVDEADFGGFLGRKAPSAENHLARQPLADEARNVLRCADRGTRPHLRAGLPEHGVLRRDHEIAPQRELVPSSHAPAVHHGDHRNRQPAYRHREAQHPVIPHVGVGEVKTLHREEIASRRERLVASARHDGTHDRRVLSCGLERVDHLVQRLLTKRVQHARTVDRYPRDLVLDLVQDIAIVPRCGLRCRFCYGFLAFGRHIAPPADLYI